MAAFGSWVYSCDLDATASAYAAANDGGSETCTCNGCRNFRAARERVYPRDFLDLLRTLGVDPRKDGEVYHVGRRVPGKHYYGGWFHFVGSLDDTGDFPPVTFGEGFRAWLCRAHAPCLSELKGKNLVQLEFQAESVPWCLDEPEPE
jgi:hypothetical protein